MELSWAGFLSANAHGMEAGFAMARVDTEMLLSADVHGMEAGFAMAHVDTEMLLSADAHGLEGRRNSGNIRAAICLMLLIAAAAMDLRYAKISNRLILAGLAIGLLVQAIGSGARGAGVFLINVSIPVILFYLLFLMRALGAGDIKLFSVIGGICGFQVLLVTVVASFLAAACMSLCKMLYHRSLISRLCIFGSYVSQSLSAGRLLKYPKEPEGKQHIIHFSIAILVGYGIAMGVVG